jgi:hypothetical protein
MTEVKIFAESGGQTVGGEPAPTPLPEAIGKPKRKLYALLGISTIAILISVIVLAFFVPRGLGETIPYGFNYSVGEKTTYNMSIAMNGAGQSISENGTFSMEILSFDGENYTINETVVLTVQGTTQQASYTIKMNKQGYMVGFSNLPSEMQQTSSMFGSLPGFGLAADKTEARVGETWQIPLNVAYSGTTMSGTMNFKFGEVQNISVPAGTYKTFKIEASTNNVQVSTESGTINVNMNGQIHLEYGTCHLIDMNMQETMTGIQAGQTMTMSLAMQMTLIQHIKP